MARFASLRHHLAVLLAVIGLGEALVLYDPTPAQARPNAITVAAQTRLAELGYLPREAISGAMDERTHQAVVAIQG